MGHLDLHIILGGIGLLQGAILWLGGKALAERKAIVDSIDRLTEKVGKQNGRIGVAEARLEYILENCLIERRREARHTVTGHSEDND